MFDDIIRDNLSPEPSKESYEKRLKFLISHMMFLSLNHSEISEQYINGLKCALALLSETDDIETMKKKINEIFGIKP